MTQKPILYVDASPDEGYPLRILRAYRENCNMKYADSTSGEEPESPLLRAMNEMQEQRAEILDWAIALLEEHRRVT